MKIRAAAERIKGMNNLKQIGLATHNFADANGVVPSLGVFTSLLPYLEQGNLEKDGREPQKVPVFVSGEDPSVDLHHGQCMISYAFNQTVFRAMGRPRWSDITDGLSNTLAFGERYTHCERDIVYISQGNGPSFADPFSFGDLQQPYVYPVTMGQPPVSHGSSPGTFQAAPSAKECDVRYLQSPRTSGMLAALCDGSVRLIDRNISETTFWSAVTPNKGEILGNDW